jgi:uncharacterized protein YjiS (DUF1127 family)
MLKTAPALMAWLERRNNRRVLMGLDDRQLADIGISRSAIESFLQGRSPLGR